MRVKVTLACSECKQRNYNTMKNKKNDPDRLEMNKYCKFCRKHTLHKEFFKDTKAELKKVTWPDKEQLIHNTGVIIVFILIITIILSVLDFGFAKLFQLLTNIL